MLSGLDLGSKLALVGNNPLDVGMLHQRLDALFRPGARSCGVLKEEVAPFGHLVSEDLGHEPEMDHGFRLFLVEPLGHLWTEFEPVKLVPSAEGFAFWAAYHQHRLLLAQQLSRPLALSQH